jgi:hypothetical protein
MHATRRQLTAGPAGPARPRQRIRGWIAAGLACCGAWAGLASAQDRPAGPLPDYAQAILEGKPLPASAIQQAGCCGNELAPAPMVTGGAGAGVSVGDCPPGCPTGHCVPGRKCPDRYGGGCGLFGCGAGGCDDGCGKFWNLCSNLFECYCCPDPCYEPTWHAVANAGLFIDHARPRSTMMFRYDSGVNLILPDRAEFFWSRIGQKGPGQAERSVNYNDLILSNEIAAGNFGLVIEQSYRQQDAEVNGRVSGFGDMRIATKSMLIDCELLQCTFQFKTYIPIGNFNRGLGIGHVALEPSFLTALKITPDTYLESQYSQWIPVGGTSGFEGNVLHIHQSLNHLWWRKKSLQFITTWEYQAYIFQNGQFTLPADLQPGGDLVTARANREAYHYTGPGARLVVCDKYDVGVGATFALSDDHFAEQLYRVEFRWRY